MIHRNNETVSRYHVFLICASVVPYFACQTPPSVLEPYGKTFYLDGAGSLGFGVTEVPEGLRRAGYQGHCEIFNWSPTHNALLDQMDPLGANKQSAKNLARRIRKYRDKFPDSEVNIIALSAGTGVATWALELLRGKYTVNNVFFLGSSLASKYDMRAALRSIGGRLYVYYSSHDLVLPMVKVIGTVDRRLGVHVAGLVGLQGRGSESDKVVNIGWEQKWSRVGWNGGHTDCVGRTFVQYEIARKLMDSSLPPSPQPAQSATLATSPSISKPDAPAAQAVASDGDR